MLIITGIKLICGATTIGSSSLIGVLKSKELDNDIYSVQELQSVITYIENEISFKRTGVIELLSFINSITSNKVIQSLFENMLAETELCKSLELASTKTITDSDINKKAKRIMISLFSSIGKSDRDVEINNLRMTISNLAKLENELIIHRDKYAKIYKGMGMLAGIGATILLS